MCQCRAQYKWQSSQGDDDDNDDDDEDDDHEDDSKNKNKLKLKYECQIALREGAGPRHMVFHPFLNVCYVSNELDSTVTVLHIQRDDDDDDGDGGECCERVGEAQPQQRNETKRPNKKKKKTKARLKVIQNLSTVPSAYEKTEEQQEQEQKNIWTKNYVAEIALSHDGRFLYVSNRGHDSIAVFAVKQDGCDACDECGMLSWRIAQSHANM